MVLKVDIKDYDGEINIDNLQFYLDNLADNLGSGIGGGGGDGSVITDENKGTVTDVNTDERLRFLFRYLHVRFSENSNGASFVTDPGDVSGTSIYIGTMSSSSATAPTEPAAFNWQEFSWSSSHNVGYRVPGGYDLRFFTSTNVITSPNRAFEDGDSPIDLEGLSIDGENGSDAIISYITTDRGTVFKNNAGNAITMTVNVNIGGATPSDADYATYDYKWTYGGNTVCVDNNRKVLNTGSGDPLVSSDGMTCTMGGVADSSINTGVVGSLRAIEVGPEDVNQFARLQAEVSNIPE